MTRLRLIAVFITLLALEGGCRQAMVTEENARGFDYSIAEADPTYRLTMAQLYEKLKHSDLYPEGGVIGVESLAVARDRIVCDAVLGFATADVRLEDHYGQFKTYRMRYNNSLIDSYLKREVYDKVEVDSLAVVDFYHSRPDLFSFDEHVLVYHIIIAPKGVKFGPDSVKYERYSLADMEEPTAEYAQEIHNMIDSPESFMEVAAQYSHDTLQGRQGGLIGWAKRGVYHDPFDSVAFALQPGDISELYHNANGWHILYCRDRLPAGIPPLNAQLYEGAVQNYRTVRANEIGGALLDTLLDEIDVEYNEDVMEGNLYLIDLQQWVAVINGQDTLYCAEARGPELDARLQHKVSNTTAEMKKEMLLRTIERYVMLQAARATGVDTLEESIAWEQGLRRKYSMQVVKQAAKDTHWKPSDSSIEQYYRQHLAKYQPAKPLKVQHILIHDSLFGDFVRGEATSGYEFLDLADEYYAAEAEQRRTLADLGAISSEDVPKAFWEAALLTPVGEVSHPIRTEQGFHLIKVLDRVTPRTLDQVRPEIAAILKDQYTDQEDARLCENLFNKYNVRLTGKLVPVYLEPLENR